MELDLPTLYCAPLLVTSKLQCSDPTIMIDGIPLSLHNQYIYRRTIKTASYSLHYVSTECYELQHHKIRAAASLFSLKERRDPQF